MSVEQTRYGTWRVRWRDVDGVRRAKSFRTQRLAERHERQVRTDTDRGLPTAPRQRISTGAWARQWLEGSHHLEPSSRRIYREALDHLLPTLEDVPLHRLTGTHISQALAGYAATGAAASSVARSYRTLRTMLNVAVERDLILKSPMRSVKPPKPRRQQMRFLTADELERLAGAIDVRYRSLILVAGWGGLRWGELAGLRCSDVDHHAAQVRIAGQLSTDGKRWKAETKTTGARRVDLPASVMAELHDVETMDRDGFVWSQPRGGPLEHTKFRQRFYVPAVVAAGLGTLEDGHYDGPRIHDLRHTAVALAVAAGAHPAEIQAQLGHTSITTTLDEYGHIMPSAVRQVAQRLDTLRGETRRLRVV
jgi:integrase